MLTRRGFLGTLIGGVAAGAAVRTWPFRVFSFPEKVVVPVVFPMPTSLDNMGKLMRIYYEPAIAEQFNKQSVLWESFSSGEMIDLKGPRHLTLPIRKYLAGGPVPEFGDTQPLAVIKTVEPEQKGLHIPLPKLNRNMWNVCGGDLGRAPDWNS